MVSPAHRLLVAAICAAAIAVAAPGDGPLAQGASQGSPQQQRPVFRAGTHFVQVDAYPRRDGKIVEGLTAKDFQVFEDGKAQNIETLEFVRVELNTPDAERRDPNTQEEGNRLAADPRNRVFVLYLDHYFSSLAGSHYSRRPIVDMLNRMLSVNDLFGVATVHTRARDLILGRRTLTIEDQLERNWTWGNEAQGVIGLEPAEQVVQRCYGEGIAMAVATRTREERTLKALDQLVRHLGVIREARKVVIIFTRGWPLAVPDEDTLHRLLTPEMASRPMVGVAPTGRLTMTPAAAPGMADWAACNMEIQRALMLDNFKTFRELIDTANQNNVTFYPVNPNGLEMTKNWSLWPMAENTGGFTLDTNDLGGLLRRITEDVSAYYVLGYYSPNTRFDGGFRKIEVKMADPGIKVKARRGYLAPVLNETASGAGSGAAKPETPEGLEEAVGVLARLRPSSELFLFGAASATEIAVVAELASQMLSAGEWAKGADLAVSVTDAAGGTSEGRGRIEPGQRGAIVRVPRPAGDGPYRVTVRAMSGADELSDRLEVATPRGALTGSALVFRATPAGQSPLRPVGDLQFRRTERAHIEWPVLGPIDRREARLLARDGRPLPVPVTVTERDVNGTRMLAADLNLAPLAVGDYVIELTAGAGEKTERRFLAIRVRQ